MQRASLLAAFRRCPAVYNCAMSYQPGSPLIIQSDKTILLEVNNPLHDEARDALARFADLEKSPEHIHT